MYTLDLNRHYSSEQHINTFASIYTSDHDLIDIMSDEKKVSKSVLIRELLHIGLNEYLSSPMKGY